MGSGVLVSQRLFNTSPLAVSISPGALPVGYVFESRRTSDSVGCANKSGSDTVDWDGYLLITSVSYPISPGG